MNSTILKTTTLFLMPMLLVFSFFLLLRGHNEPGGGFMGGLVAAASYSLYSIAFGVDKARKILGVQPLHLIALGVLIALLSGIYPLFFDKIFFTGMWSSSEYPIVGKIGTPLIFDIGVYLLVIGIVLKIIFSLSEEPAL
jgi:multicomponent Na+:H+ antiporter subunit B